MPLSIQHQADSAGDKAVSLIADNSGSNVAAAFKGVNKATQNGDTVADLVVSLDGEAISTGATDDAAAAGAIFPVAGLYQVLGSVDEIDTGDVGRLRATARRAAVVSPDFRQVYANNSTVANAGDMEVSTSAVGSGYAAPTTAFFDGADAGFGASARWIRVPMWNWRVCAPRLYHTLGVNLTVKLYAWLSGASLTGDGGGGSGAVYLDTVSVATASHILFVPWAAGAAASANIRTVAGLALPMSYLIVELTPASDPSTGLVQFVVGRR